MRGERCNFVAQNKRIFLGLSLRGDNVAQEKDIQEKGPGTQPGPFKDLHLYRSPPLGGNGFQLQLLIPFTKGRATILPSELELETARDGVEVGLRHAIAFHLDA